jgi:hypothetical protein
LVFNIFFKKSKFFNGITRGEKINLRSIPDVVLGVKTIRKASKCHFNPKHLVWTGKWFQIKVGT